MLGELQRQYKGELRKECGRHKEERVKASRLKPQQRKNLFEKLAKKKKKRLKAIKGIYKKRVKVVKELKKGKKKSEVDRKLAEWKKQGYNVNEFLIKTEKVSKKELGKDVGKFKKQGYKL